jgi:NTE family protein
MMTFQNIRIHRTIIVLLLCSAILHLQAQQLSGDRVPRGSVIRPEFSNETSRFPSILSHRGVQRPKVALVLSGGGSRGVSVIGVLRAFEQAEIPIDMIVGTSMGSIVGGLYASGYSTKQLEQLVDTTKWDELLSFNDEARRKDLFYDQKLAEDRSILVVRFKGFEPIIPSSYSTGQAFLNYLNILTLQGIYHPNPSFNNLRIPFRATASDLISGKRVVMDHGDLAEAMRASMTVPLLFSPVARDSMLLVDGGLVSNIPVDVAHDLGADIVIAVDATSPLRPANKLGAAWEIGDQIMGVMMKTKKEEELKQADVVIRPALEDVYSTDFSRLDWVMDRGEQAAVAQLSAIKALIRQRSRNAIRPAKSDAAYPHPVVTYDAQSLGSPWSQRLSAFAQRSTVSEEDVQIVVNELYDAGDFESVEVAVSGEADTTRLQLLVKPYPVVNRFDVTGATVVPPDTLQLVIQPLVGRHLNSRSVTRMFESLLGVYRDRGFSLARIHDARLEASTGVVTIEIDEGIVYRRDIRGTVNTKDYVIWRELPWEEQTVFNVAKVARGIANLYGTNLFEYVSVGLQYEGPENELNVVTINVRERSTDLIRLGMRIDNERNLQPSLDVRDENFLGIGMELGGRVYGGQRNRGYVGEFKATRIFNSYLTFNLKASYEYRDVNVYSDDAQTDATRWNRVKVGEYRELRSGGTVAFGTQLERLGIASLEGRLETHRVWSISGNPLNTESFRVGSLKFGTKLDTEDQFPFPREGSSMIFSYESAFVRLAGNTGFTKLYFNYETYQTYFRRHTLRPKITFGFADETLPITERFSIGGQNSFFGLPEDNARGRQLFIASLEYRFQSPVKIFFDTYLKARYDFGTIWAVAEAIKLRDLRHGIGVGLALNTPVGPAEFSVGRSFYFRNEVLEHPVTLGPWLFYFSVGYPL